MFMTDEKFYFKTVTEDIVRKEIMTLDGSKTTPNGVILVNTLKLTVNIHLLYTTTIINFSIGEGQFPDELKDTMKGYFCYRLTLF